MDRRLAGCCRALVAIAIGWIACAPLAHGLDPGRRITQYIQTSWTSDSGLPQNSVHAIAQTTDGYLWLGTEEGLARFDGVHFRVFTHERFPGLASDFIEALAPGPDGALWIGTDSGLTYYQPGETIAGARFRRLTVRDGLASDYILSLYEDRDGALWVGTSRGLDRIVGARIESMPGSEGPGRVPINALALDGKGTLWVGTDHGVFHREGHRFVNFTTMDGLPGDHVTALAAGPDGVVWVGTLRHGIARIEDGRATVPGARLSWNQVDGLLVDRNGALWISFDRHGIGRLCDGRFEAYDSSRGLPSNRSTRALFEDRGGSLWLGLLDAGLVQLRDGKFAVFGRPEGLSGNYVGNVLEAQDGSIWIGADSNGLDQLLADGRVRVWNRKQGLPNQAVFALMQTRDGSVWVGYHLGALARIRGRQVTVYRSPRAGGASINALYQDQEGRLWVGFYGKGLALLEDGRYHFAVRSGNILDIAQSPDGAIWAATDGEGVERIDGKQITRYTVADGLPSNHVMCVYADEDDSVWVGTASGGLSRIRDGRIVSWTRKQGLPASTIGSILQDNFGNLWMGGDTGIFRVSKEALIRSAADPGAMLHPLLFGTADGLRSRETVYGSMPAAWKGRDGRLWFATIKGAAVVDPAALHMDTQAPPVHIEEVRFDHRAVPVRNWIRLGPGTGNLEIRFAALSYDAPQRVHSRYRLLGFDRRWTDAWSRRMVWYTNLHPGRYVFEVQAENADGVWNRTGASFAFVLAPPLAETMWAYAGYGFLLILVGWGAIAFRTRHLLRRKRELEGLVAERTSQLEREKTALESARNELQIRATHDSLSGLFNRAAILEHLEREVCRAVREGTTLGVLLIDLDHFKRVNDQFGHLCGDEVIREAAHRLSQAMRGYDLAGRYGGEEFLVILPHCDILQHPERADELLDAIRSRPFQTRENSLQITCSIGAGTFRPGIDPVEVRDVISRADTALYVAKSLGRDCAAFEARSAAG